MKKPQNHKDIQEFFPLNSKPLLYGKQELRLDLYKEGYNYISYSGKDKGFYAIHIDKLN